MSENKKRLHKQLELDAAVSKFEEAWHQDPHPRIEDWIVQYQEMSRPELFEELLVLCPVSILG